MTDFFGTFFSTFFDTFFQYDVSAIQIDGSPFAPWYVQDTEAW